jgi:hypothetical protein
MVHIDVPIFAGVYTGGFMPFHRQVFAILPLLGLSTLGLHAASPVRYGCSVQANVPLSDLKTDVNGKLGGGASFQVTFDAGERLQVRPRFDVDFYRVSDYHRSGSHYEESNNLFSVGVGADLLYTFTGTKDRGSYGLVGAGILQWTQNFTVSDRWDHDNHYWDDVETKKNRVSPWIAAGVGYQFNRMVGVEARAVMSQYDSPTEGGLSNMSSDVPTDTRTAVTAQAAVTFRW